MNRRKVLQSASVLATVGLAGCIDGVQEHFGLQGVVPIEIYNEGEQTYNLQLQARERETDRNTYDESYSIPPGETVQPPHLGQTAQSLQVIRFDQDNEPASVEAASITPETSMVAITIHDDELVVEVRESEDGAANESAANESAANESAEE